MNYRSHSAWFWFMGNGKLHAQKFEAHPYSREDNQMMLFKLWLADNEFTSVVFKLMSTPQKYTYSRVTLRFSYH